MNWNLNSALAQSCAGCSKPQPIEYFIPACTPTATPTRTPTSVPTRTPTPACVPREILVDDFWKCAGGGEYWCGNYYYACKYYTKLCKNSCTLQIYTCGTLNVSSRCGTNNGCFVPGTQIRLMDGSDKKIEELSPVDQVWNPITKSGMRVANWIVGPEENQIYKVKAENIELTVTSTHPMAVWIDSNHVKREGDLSSELKTVEHIAIRQVKNLLVGDAIVTADGKTHTLVSSIEKIDPQAGLQVHNIEFEG